MFKKLPLKERIQIASKLKECDEYHYSSVLFEKMMNILTPMHDVDLDDDPIALLFNIVETLIAHKIEEVDFQTAFDIVIVHRQNEFDRDQKNKGTPIMVEDARQIYDHKLKGMPIMVKDAKQMLPLILHYTYHNVKTEQEKDSGFFLK